MNILVFLNSLGLGGTEKAAIRWAIGLKARGHRISAASLQDGPRRSDLERHSIPIRITDSGQEIRDALRELSPDIIHAHAPGFPHSGDILGQELLALSRQIPVVQTNVFGRLNNPREDAWTTFRLFISWTSCIQAARRSFRRPNERFFRNASVAVYPLDPVVAPLADHVQRFREQIGVGEHDVLFGRFSRPEPNKWTSLALDAFHLAMKKNPGIKLLLREPPPKIAETIRNSLNSHRFIILPATSDPAELDLTLAATDAVLHTSSIGESFGYGIAEPMNLGKPVITHSVPWEDQAQIELVRHKESGFVASTPETMADAILAMAGNAGLRETMGKRSQEHIRSLADAQTSISRIERVFEAVLSGHSNPFLKTDIIQAEQTAAYLDEHQFGHTFQEQVALRPLHYRVRFHQWRQFLARSGKP